MYALSTNLENIDDVSEETSMDSISFLPSELGKTKKAIVSLATQMPEWNIEILEDNDVKRVVFGESLTINVGNEDWEAFLNIFDNCCVANNKVNLTSMLCEAVNDEMDDLLKNLKPQLIKTFTENPLDEAQLDINRWKTRFSVDKYKNNDCLVSYQSKNNDLRKLYNGILKFYKGDKGNLEMLTDALEGKTSLASFRMFNDFKYLYGTRVFSRFHGIKMILEVTVDLEFNIAETVYIDDQDVLDTLGETKAGYKIKGNVVFPKGQRFNESFYRILENSI